MFANRLLFRILVVLALSGCSRMPSDATEATTAVPAAAVAMPSDADLLARGNYLVRIAACNDCHTPGYAETAGAIPQAQWLVGTPLGWHGPWGTTFPANLRLKLQEMYEAAWMKYSGELHTRPPMPDFAVRTVSEDDRRGIYRFIRSLGPAGQPAPAYLPPGQDPQPPYGQWALPSGPPPARASSAG